jgi:hypothetical protein
MQAAEEPEPKYAKKETEGKAPFSYMTDVFFTHATTAARNMTPLMGDDVSGLLDNAIIRIMQFTHTENTGLELIAEAAGFVLMYYKAARHSVGPVIAPHASQITLHAMLDYSNVRLFGAKKYARNNWKLGIPFTKTIDAVLRHLFAYVNGQFIDPESGISHLGHVLCDLEHMIFFIGNKEMIKKLDDRFV